MYPCKIMLQCTSFSFIAVCVLCCVNITVNPACVEQTSMNVHCSGFPGLKHSVNFSLLSSLGHNLVTEGGAYRIAEMLETNLSLQTLE